MNFYENESPNVLRRIISWTVDIIVVIAFAWFFLYSFGTQITVSGQSMTPLLRSGDVVLMNRLVYDLSSPDRNDIVVFQREDEKLTVQRVSGYRGEVVQIIDGWRYLFGEQGEEVELGPVSSAGLAENPVELEAGEYFLLGDNRDSSEDSRFTNIGNVKKEQIIGKVWLRILPLLDIKLIRS